MPIHDWTKVDAGVLHSFHNSWIGEIVKILNDGVLPDDYYAMGEQIAGEMGPDVLTLRIPAEPQNGTSEIPGATAVAVAPPRVSLTAEAEVDEYALKQRTLVIRHTSNHRIVAMIEIVSSGNKSSEHAIRSFVEKAVSAIVQKIHVHLVDLFPPCKRDPNGVHGLIWKKLTNLDYDQPENERLTLAAYVAGPRKRCYVEPLAVGTVLPAMPLFLTSEYYIEVPLQTTYDAAYQGVPRFYRKLLESADSN